MIDFGTVSVWRVGDKYRAGCPFYYAERDSFPEAIEWFFNDEDHCMVFLRWLTPRRPKPALCRLGLHDMRQQSRLTGGGFRLHWGYCTRCKCGFYETNGKTTFSTFKGASPQ